METKRCERCHKLQPIDARMCNRCGMMFVAKKKRNVPVAEIHASRPSLPPASPHLAGHYFGVHPEDQPYISNKIYVQRTPLEEEPEHIVFPATDETPTFKVHPPVPPANRSVKPAEKVFIKPPAYMSGKSLLSSQTISLILAVSCICFLLASSIIAFVLIRSQAVGASASISASPTTVQANGIVTLTGQGFGAHDSMTFTYDKNKNVFDEHGYPLVTHVNNFGTFVVHILIADTWGVGGHTIIAADESLGAMRSARITIQAPSTPVAASLHLTVTVLTYTTNAASNPADQTITLQNNGTQRLNWRGTVVTPDDAAPWLTLLPAQGQLDPAASVDVTASVNALQLSVGSYQEQLIFSAGKNMQVDVHLNVKPLAVLLPNTDPTPTPTIVTPSPTPTPTAIPIPVLSIQPLELTVSANKGKNPVAQTLAIANTGDATLNWSIAQPSGSVMSWLSLDTTSGSIKPGAPATIITISYNSSSEDVGVYKTTLIINDTDPDTTVVSKPIPVTLTIS